jgi:hypothetical protein
MGDRLFHGKIFCTEPDCFAETQELYRRNDAYKAYCHRHKPEDLPREELALATYAMSFPWRDVVKLTIHKLDMAPADRKGDIITVEMRDVANIEWMRAGSIEVCQGLMLMADRRCVIHNYGERGEQNYCWVEPNYFWERPASCTIRDKYWGDQQIQKFRDVCRMMAELHDWELVDESLDLLDRIVDALDKSEKKEK